MEVCIHLWVTGETGRAGESAQTKAEPRFSWHGSLHPFLQEGERHKKGTRVFRMVTQLSHKRVSPLDTSPDPEAIKLMIQLNLGS